MVLLQHFLSAIAGFLKQKDAEAHYDRVEGDLHGMEGSSLV